MVSSLKPEREEWIYLWYWAWCWYCQLVMPKQHKYSSLLFAFDLISFYKFKVLWYLSLKLIQLEGKSMERTLPAPKRGCHYLQEIFLTHKYITGFSSWPSVFGASPLSKASIREAESRTCKMRRKTKHYGWHFSLSWQEVTGLTEGQINMVAHTLLKVIALLLIGLIKYLGKNCNNSRHVMSSNDINL